MNRILGTGIFNLDTIVVREYPEGPQNARRFVEKTVADEVGGTTLLKVTHKQNPDGTPKVSVRAGSPGGSRFPRRHFLRMRDEAQVFIDSLDFVPEVFFFDDPAAGHRLMAKALHEKGALVYFEPSAIKEKKDFDAINVSDVIKFSGENIQDVSFAEGRKDKLFIQTLGSEGLRFNLKGAGWVSLPPVANDNVVDWEGAGDWTTSAFLNALAKADCLSIDKMNEEIVRTALEKAQETASKSVSYMGSKGMIKSNH